MLCSCSLEPKSSQTNITRLWLGTSLSRNLTLLHVCNSRSVARPVPLHLPTQSACTCSPEASRQGDAGQCTPQQPPASYTPCNCSLGPTSA